jgi:GT2 family glycosyltransferase
MAVLQEKTSRISIIIVNYKTPELVINLVKQLGDSEFEVIVIDNSPTNELQAQLPTDVLYYFLNKNTGFAPANNIGIKKASADWILLLNSDIETNRTEVKRLLDIAAKSKTLVAAPQLVGKNNVVQDNVGYFDSFAKNPLNAIFIIPRFIDCKTILETKNVDLGTAAALLIHKSVFKDVGYFDERYFMYFEDIDWSYQLFKNKIDVLYVPEVKFIHYGGESSKNNLNEKNKLYTKSLNAYLQKNRGYFIEKVNSLFHFLK